MFEVRRHEPLRTLWRTPCPSKCQTGRAAEVREHVVPLILVTPTGTRGSACSSKNEGHRRTESSRDLLTERSVGQESLRAATLIRTNGTPKAASVGEKRAYLRADGSVNPTQAFINAAPRAVTKQSDSRFSSSTRSDE